MRPRRVRQPHRRATCASRCTSTARPTPDACRRLDVLLRLGGPRRRSSIGERFAGLVQREIVARTDLARPALARARPGTCCAAPGCPPSGSTLGYLTNAGDAARLADPDFRDVIAEAVVVAVQRVYLDPDVRPARPACSASASSARRASSTGPSPSLRPTGAAVRRRVRRRRTHGRAAGCRTGRTAPSSRSSALSTSSRQVSAERSSSRIRG